MCKKHLGDIFPYAQALWTKLPGNSEVAGTRGLVEVYKLKKKILRILCVCVWHKQVSDYFGAARK